MGNKPAENERYTIRRKVLKLFGAAFHVYDEQGSVVGYCKQKAFKLKEDIKLYTGEDMNDMLLSIQAQSIIDFSAAYTVVLPDGTALGSLRRKGLKSSFIRDEWTIFDTNNNEIATIRELGSITPIIRRYLDAIAFLFPQKYELTRKSDAQVIAVLRNHFNIFISKLGVAIVQEDESIDELLVLGAACLITAIEGRQN
tara:strand:- start:12925 stop:13518 length:594 start_codon:yes stop_codon:yes gene_type:complete